MKDILIEIYEERLRLEISEQSALSILKNYNVKDYIDKVIEKTYLYTRPRQDVNTFPLAEIISAIGKGVLKILKIKNNSALAAKIGAFFLYTFEELGVIEVVLVKNKKHNIYSVKLLDDGILVELWGTLPLHTIEKLPLLKPSYSFVKATTGMIRSKYNYKDFNKDTHPIVFSCINKSKEVSWKVNTEVLEIAKWALKNNSEAFNDIWNQTKEAKKTKIREAKTIIDIAERFKDTLFYHEYYYDFRGRKYSNTSYFSEQGSDLSRGLLLRGDSKPIGKQGFFWLCVCLANNWGASSGREDGRNTDKIPLQDRFQWVLDNEELLIKYAIEPKIVDGWMQADKPWEFLAGCFELYKFRQNQKHSEDYSYESSLEGYIDG